MEIGCPAVHETIADHDFALPNNKFAPDRLFSGQRFVRHTAQDALWSPWKIVGFETRDTGIAVATNGLAGARVVRTSGQHAGSISHDGEFLFLFVLRGVLGVGSDGIGSHQLHENENCVIPAKAKFQLSAGPGLEMLVVTLPAD